MEGFTIISIDLGGREECEAAHNQRNPQCLSGLKGEAEVCKFLLSQIKSEYLRMFMDSP